MADYDNPRPSSQPEGSTEMVVAKDNLITLDLMAVSSDPTVTNRKGQVLTTFIGASDKIDADVLLVDAAKDQALIDIAADVAEVEAEAAVAIPIIIADAEQQIATAIAAAGYQITGDFSDVIVAITDANQVLTSKSVVGFEDYVWRTNQPLPYTRTGSDPTQAPELGKWLAVSIGELETVARSLNVLDSDIIYSTDTVTPIPAYIYSPSQQKTYSVPADAVGKTIDSVVVDVLNTTVDGPYQLISTTRSEIMVSYFDTLEDAINSPLISKMKAVDIKNRTAGNNDGGSFWDVVLTSTVTPNTWDVVESPVDALYSIVLRAFNNSLNVKAAGAIGKILNSDSAPFQACATRASEQGLDLFLPPVRHDEGYYLADAVVIENIVLGLANAIKVYGGGQVNSAGTCARVLYPVEGIAFHSKQIGGMFDNMTFEHFVGSPQGTVTATNTIGPLSITVDYDPWSLTGGVPILWTNTVTLTDATTRTNFFQFAVFGAWTATGVTNNGNGTWTLDDVKGINGTLDSALGAIQIGKVIEGFSSYAHFEIITPSTESAIFLDTAENGYYSNLWFTQVKRCLAHDLGSGAGLDTNKGNLGIFSNIIVDGANDFIANTDISGPSQQSLHGGQFTNLQLFSTRNAFNGRRLQNLQFATLTFNFSDTLLRASELQGCTVGAGSIIGWETGTGFISDVINITGLCADLTLDGNKFGRHSAPDGPVITVGQMINLSMNGNSLESVSEGGGATAAWLHTENTLTDSNIGGNSIGRIGAGEEELTWSTGASFTSASDFDETRFNQSVKTFTLPANLAHHQSNNILFNYMDSRLTFKSGGTGSTAVDANDAWVYVDNKSYYRFNGTLTGQKTITLPNFGDRPFDPDQFTFDMRAVNLGGFNFVINSSVTGTILVAPKAGTYTVKKVGGEWIPFNYILVNAGGTIL